MILFPILARWPDPPKLPEVPYLRLTQDMLNDRKHHIARIMLERIGRSAPLLLDHEDVPCLVQGIDYIWEDRTYVIVFFNAHFASITVDQMVSEICPTEQSYREARKFTDLLPFVEAWANVQIHYVRELWSAAI